MDVLLKSIQKLRKSFPNTNNKSFVVLALHSPFIKIVLEYFPRAYFFLTELVPANICQLPQWWSVSFQHNTGEIYGLATWWTKGGQVVGHHCGIFLVQDQQHQELLSELLKRIIASYLGILFECITYITYHFRVRDIAFDEIQV